MNTRMAHRASVPVRQVRRPALLESLETRRLLAAITGLVAWDADGDGLFDAGESPLPGRTVWADVNGNWQFDGGDVTAVSGADGTFTIDNLDPGAYGVYQVVPDGWKESSPANHRAEVFVDAATVDAGFFLTNSYSPSPYVDASFGTGGAVSTPDSGVNSMHNLQRLPDGRLVTMFRSSAGFHLLRLMPDGSPDPSFGSNGVVQVTPPKGVSSFDGELCVQNDGGILASASAGTGRVAVVRFLPSGQIDAGFGTGGAAVIETNSSRGIRGIALDRLGRIAVALFAQTSAGPGPGNVAIARLTTQGQLDGTFGTGGVAMFDIAGGAKEVWSLAIQSDNRIVLAGSVGMAGFVMRASASGQKDTSFGTGGLVLTQSGPQVRWSDVKVLPDDRIVAAGLAQLSFAVIRLTRDGLPDLTFGAGGTGQVVLPFFKASGWPAHSSATEVEVLPDGSTYLAGAAYTTVWTAPDFAAVRLRPNGTPDGSFGNGGYATVPLGTNSQSLRGIAVDPFTGQLLLSGYWTPVGGPHHGVILRLDLNTTRATVLGSEGDDEILIGLSGDRFAVTLNGITELLPVGIQTVVADGLGGDDLIDVSQSITANMQLSGGDGNDTLLGGGGNDVMYGGADHDQLRGRGGNDFLYGGSGHDWILGGAGNDYLYGEAGNDVLHGGTGADWIIGGGGTDLADYSDRSAPLVIALDNAVGGDGEAGENDSVWSDVEKVYGGSSGDAITGSASNNGIYGLGGDDTINGMGGNDVVWGGDGNDLIFGGAGHDYLYGAAGNDTVHGQDGNDAVYGNDGNDSLTGGDGNDAMYAGKGTDTLLAGAGDDWLFASENDGVIDLLDGDLGWDRAASGPGDLLQKIEEMLT